ncbi:MAG: SHOCT-like domain-containing protein [Bacillota bacterium]
MENERLQILKMVQSGKITAEEASKLLLAVDEGSMGSTAVASEAKWLKVRVTDLNTGKAKVNVNLPIALLEVGLNIGMKFVPEETISRSGGIDLKELVTAIRKGAIGKLVEVEDDDEGIRVEVIVE